MPSGVILSILPSFVNPSDFSLDQPEHGVVTELHQSKVPAVRLEIRYGENQLLHVAVEQVEHKHRNATQHELHRLTEIRDIEAQNTGFRFLRLRVEIQVLPRSHFGVD